MNALQGEVLTPSLGEVLMYNASIRRRRTELKNLVPLEYQKDALEMFDQQQCIIGRRIHEADYLE
jgi:hypothetical protein